MKTKGSFLVIISLFSIAVNAQKKNINLSNKPASIYTFSKAISDKNGFSAINKKLQLTNFNFVYVDLLDLDLNRMSIDSNNLRNTPSAYIFDDYKRYQDRNLLKGFLLENDPTRWNLQCQNPLSVQPIE
ncbi:hypothetical protein K8354_14800 [Polaribacter litorisediminis]|uniref:hypothetical protein n=1 Tax=Polaribacter litorisediminis TaxID=1908341 RepID=UPI001CC19F24|nr:hypothetical protein [Polaribacter litorisediminis]UAM97560.1 hypothetical protein K8354_14800 [Polaribacter litorisediminis]